MKSKKITGFVPVLDTTYDQIMAQIVKMINEADKWLIK